MAWPAWHSVQKVMGPQKRLQIDADLAPGRPQNPACPGARPPAALLRLCVVLVLSVSSASLPSRIRPASRLPRWLTALALAGLALGTTAAATVAWALQQANARMQRDVPVKSRAVAYTTDAGTIERGRRLYQDAGCVHCHGADGRGLEFAKGPGLRLVAPNLTPAGAVARYQPEDWNGAIRHGVKPSGRPVLAMPSERYNGWSLDELSALVAYLRQLPPAPGEAAVVQWPLAQRLRYGLGWDTDAAARIDHRRPPPRSAGTPAPPDGLALQCTGCGPVWPMAWSEGGPGGAAMGALARPVKQDAFVR